MARRVVIIAAIVAILCVGAYALTRPARATGDTALVETFEKNFGPIAPADEQLLVRAGGASCAVLDAGKGVPAAMDAAGAVLEDYYLGGFVAGFAVPPMCPQHRAEFEAYTNKFGPPQMP